MAFNNGLSESPTPPIDKLGHTTHSRVSLVPYHSAPDGPSSAMNSKLIIFSATALLAVAVALNFFFRSPERLHLLLGPPPVPGSRDRLHAAKIVVVPAAHGPESLAFNSNGRGPYAGVADGRILRWDGDGRGWSEFAVTTSQRKECVRPFAPEMEHVCGRPLGLKFHKKTDELYIADAYLGLKVVGPDGGLATELVSEVEGRPLRFTNDLDIDDNNDVIYFTDTSTTFQRRQFLVSILNGDKTGRLLKYNISSKEVTVLVEGLSFANGVALSKDRSFVLVAETSGCRIRRLWLQGPNAGKVDVFAELPGFPDNIRRNHKGEFWVALHSKKGPLSRFAVFNAWAGKTMLRLPFSFQQLHSLLIGGKAHATAIKLSEEGSVLDVLEDCDGKIMKFPSEVEEKDGKLWIGSVLTPFIGIYDLE